LPYARRIPAVFDQDGLCSTTPRCCHLILGPLMYCLWPCTINRQSLQTITMQGMRGKLMHERNSQTAGFIQKQDADDDNDKNDPPSPMLIMMRTVSKKRSSDCGAPKRTKRR
jgi:hypothetical protein